MNEQLRVTVVAQRDVLNALRHRGEVNCRRSRPPPLRALVLNALRHRGEVNPAEIVARGGSFFVLNALRHRGEVNCDGASLEGICTWCSTPYGIEAR